ncbi:MAG: Plasma membrane sulfite pump involved in sulfite metabolism [Cyphobasidiales sp. Tagirdzhanova-0007]|nr:MAG: Plasma membrane sulfite pump involved in sulfite metabolism [Cyphobasidiales sp. Tagirdzhanova-0007]
MRDGLHGPACYADDAQAYFGVTHGCVAFPIVPPITIAASGATISNLLIPTHPEYALTIWIASYIMNGIGCLLAAFVLVLYFQRLSLHHIPGREVVVTIFLPLGPCGQGGYALLQLGRVSRTLFPIISAAHPADIDGLAILEDTANAFGVDPSYSSNTGHDRFHTKQDTSS